MLVIGFLQWWYGPGWRDAGNRILGRVKSTYQFFSIAMLLRTLFLPWRRIISYSEGSLQQRLRAAVDNLVSRGVGFSIRIMALLTAVVLMTLTFVIGGALVILWPLLPLISVGLMVGGLAL